MYVETQKRLVIDRSGFNIRSMFEKELLSSCQHGSSVYNNVMLAFDDCLYQLVQEAFKLGEESK